MSLSPGDTICIMGGMMAGTIHKLRGVYQIPGATIVTLFVPVTPGSQQTKVILLPGYYIKRIARSPYVHVDDKDTRS